MEMTRKIDLVTKEGTTVSVEQTLIMKSLTIRDVLVNLGLEEDTKLEPIPIPNCSAEHLRMIIKWLERHRTDADVDDEERARNRFNLDIPEDDRKMFQAMHIDDVAKLLITANYLDIPTFFDQLIKFIANLINDNNSTPEAIGKVLNMGKRVAN
ncbi:hypothetical protein QR680_012548 [Steinernema hermaphroditum]|uniref:Skp1-related protein n=1 Tax=Steinernema hermaphroditum TaxID=289476 RepID=A0AA39M0P6_9BILA|nr:hypothetical protein QR680_012548 [Steinernema hermaphroditum]